MDCEQFRKENPLPVFPGKVNRWLLARSDEGDDGRNENLVREDLKTRVFSTGWIGGGIDKYQNLSIKVVTQNGQPAIAPPIAKRRDQLTALPILSGKKPWYVSVEFSYYGEASTIGWVAIGKTFSCDITQLDWTVLAVGAPLVDAPPEETILGDISAAGTAVGEVLDKSTNKLLIGGAIALGILYFWKVK